MAFLSLVLYTLIIYVRPQEIFLELWRAELVMYGAIATAAFAFLTEAWDPQRLFKHPALRCLLGFLASAALSHLSYLYLTGAKESFQEVAKLVVLVVLIVWIVRTPRRLRLYVWTLLLATGLLAVQGIQQFITGVNWGGLPLTQHWTEEVPRIIGLGIFRDPNDLALAMVFVIPFGLESVMGGVLPRSRLVGASILGVLLYATYLTRSRGGFLALGACVLTLIAQRVGLKAAIVSAVGMAGGIIALAPGQVAAALTTDSSSMGRLWLWSEGLQMLKMAPLFGVGQGFFMDYVPKAAHNSVITALAETGLVGAFFWIGMYYFAIKDLVRLAGLRRDPDPGIHELAAIAGMLLAGVAGYLTAAFFLSRTYVVITYIPLGLAVATAQIAAGQRPALAESARPTQRDWAWIAGIEVGIILGIYILVRTVRW